MTKKLSLLVLIVLSFCFYSCKREYNKTENGALMKFFIINDENERPEIGDLVIIDVTQKIADSVIFSSEDMNEPFEIILEEPSFEGDIMSALLSMHLDDHASLIFPIDSLFYSIGEEMPSFIESGTLTEMDIKLREIIKKEEYEDEIRKELELRKRTEEDNLSVYYNDNQYSVTEDSLIIVKMDRGLGRLADPSDIMRVYFTFKTYEGDTLLDFSSGEPYELICGDKALGEGFSEGLSLVGKGGSAEFIIPSSLAFGADGFAGTILPYTTFVLNLEVVDIMTSEEYEKEQDSIAKKEAAENLKRLEEEPYKISKYLSDNNIAVQPTSSGLYYIEDIVGKGDVVNTGDMVLVHYSIYNIENKLIESSVEYGQPISFVHGDGTMIKGIDEAVGYMKVGGKSRIIVPSALGFGEIKIDDELPANSTLIIDLELVEVKK